MREAQLNEAVPYGEASPSSVCKKTVTRNILEELKFVQKAWLSPASGSEKALDEQDKEQEF